MLRRLAVAEADLQRLAGELRTIPRRTGDQVSSTKAGTTVLGSLVTSLKRILNLGFVWIGNQVNVKTRANYGLNLDTHGLALKKQAAEPDAGVVGSVEIVAGTDAIDLADANTKIATMVGEINAIKTTLNNLLAKLRTAEVINT